MTINLYFVRHGQTLFNLLTKFQGWCDSDLTEKGINDALAAGKRLANIDFTSAYSSDLKRANDTAKYILSQNLINPNLKINVLQDLREEYFGGFEASVIPDVMKLLGVKNPTETAFRDLCKEKGFTKVIDDIAKLDPLALAEDSKHYQKRIKGALEKIILDNQNKNSNILIVTHSNTIKLINHLLGHPENCCVSIHNGSVTKVIYEDNAFRLDLFNDNKTIFEK